MLLIRRPNTIIDSLIVPWPLVLSGVSRGNILTSRTDRIYPSKFGDFRAINCKDNSLTINQRLSGRTTTLTGWGL